MISAIEYRKREVEIKGGSEVHVLLFFTLHYKSRATANIKLFKKSQDTDFRLLDENLECGSFDIDEVKDCLQSFDWIPKGKKKKLRQSGVCVFFAMHGIEKVKVFKGSLSEKYSCIDAETWFGNTDIKF